tara:strand:+ start:177 stop:527 length:351 start_codon:yes stop_codon:yes gene_type:complete
LQSKPKEINPLTLKSWLDSEIDKPLIIDVRESSELQIARFPYTDLHIPISLVTVNFVKDKLNNFERNKYVILCHRGIRSYNFGNWLLENKFVSEVWNLTEGIDGWSRLVDSKIPRY